MQQMELADCINIKFCVETKQPVILENKLNMENGRPTEIMMLDIYFCTVGLVCDLTKVLECGSTS